MKLVKVIKNGEVVQPVRFDNDADMNQWIKMLADTGAWGLPERWLADHPMSPLSEEEKAKAVESRKVITVEAKPESTIQVQKELEDGSVVLEDEVIPAVEEQFYMEYKFAAEYAIDIEDITAQVEAEKQAKEAKKLAKEKRKADRKLIDWSKINSVAELRAIVKSLVEEIED